VRVVSIVLRIKPHLAVPMCKLEPTLIDSCFDVSKQVTSAPARHKLAVRGALSPPEGGLLPSDLHHF